MIVAALANVKTLGHEIVEQPHEADIRAALNRVVASAHLRKSPQLANFLRFVVEEQLAGHGSRLKAYTIAADALGRDANFDPQNDPIVRVEAGRLRRALDHYYTDGGCNDPIVIELPREHYVPVFRANNALPRHQALPCAAPTVRRNGARKFPAGAADRRHRHRHKPGPRPVVAAAGEAELR
jgi:hypothetical protein